MKFIITKSDFIQMFTQGAQQVTNVTFDVKNKQVIVETEILMPMFGVPR